MLRFVVIRCVIFPQKKKPMREKYGLTDDMVLSDNSAVTIIIIVIRNDNSTIHRHTRQVLPFDVVPIINTPGLGTQPAKDLCIEMKVTYTHMHTHTTT